MEDGQEESLEERLRGQLWQKKKINLPVVVIDDQQYLLDYSDITGMERDQEDNWSKLYGGNCTNFMMDFDHWHR